MQDDTTEHDTPSPTALAGLAALTTLLMVFQYTTLAKFSILPPGVRHHTLNTLIGETVLKVGLTRYDLLLALLILVVFLALVVSHLLKGSLTGIAKWCLTSERRAVLGLSLLSALSVRFYLAPGEISWGADSGPHLSYAWVASKSIANGELPIWTNYFGTGTPFCQFYGFLFYYITGFIHLIVRDVFLSMKLAMGLGHIVSGLSMYFLARSRGIRRGYAIVSALAYVLTFWHTQQSLIMGRFPVSWVYALLPLSFAFTARLIRADQPSIHHIVIGAFSLASVTFTHPGYGLWTTVFLFVYGVSDLCVIGGMEQRKAAISFGILLALGTILGGYLWLPMIVERAYTGLNEGLNLASLPDPHWSQLILWSNYRYMPSGMFVKHWYGGYLGLSILVTGLIACIPVGKSAHVKRILGPGLCLLLSLLLVFGYRWLGGLPFVQTFNAGRYLLFVVFSLSLLLPEGLTRLHLILKHHRPRQYAICAGIILFVDLGPTTFQQPYMPDTGQLAFHEEDLELHRKQLELVPPGEIPNSRAMHLSSSGTAYQEITWLVLKTGIPSPLGAFDEIPPAVWGFIEPLKKRLRQSMQEDQKLEDYDQLSALAFLLNDNLLYANRMTGKSGFVMDRYELPDRIPVVVSGRTTSWTDRFDRSTPISDQELAALLARLRVDSKKHSLLELPLLNGPEVDLGTDPSCVVLDHGVRNQSVDMTVQIDSRCFVRLSYAYHPYLRVSVDGQDVETFETATRFLAIQLEAGTHKIEIIPVLSPLRRLFLGINILVLLGYLLYLYRERSAK